MDDDDLVVRERPRRRRSPASGRWRTLASALVRVVLAPLWRRPLRSVTAAAFVGVTAAVLVNALMMQSRRHPSPLFKPAPAVVERSADAKLRAQREAATRDVGTILPPSRPLEQRAVPQGEVRPVQNQRAAADPIAEMIRGAGGELRAEPSRPAVEPSRPVMAAQRALTRLNYGTLKADGLMGAGTRAAIERFEKDRGLPVSGELSPRVAKALSAAAGIPVE